MNLPGNPTKTLLCLSLAVVMDAGLMKMYVACPCHFLIIVLSFNCDRRIDQFRLSTGDVERVSAGEQSSFHDTARLQISIEFAIQSHEA